MKNVVVSESPETLNMIDLDIIEWNTGNRFLNYLLNAMEDHYSSKLSHHNLLLDFTVLKRICILFLIMRRRQMRIFIKKGKKNL